MVGPWSTVKKVRFPNLIKMHNPTVSDLVKLCKVITSSIVVGFGSTIHFRKSQKNSVGLVLYLVGLQNTALKRESSSSNRHHSAVGLVLCYHRNTKQLPGQSIFKFAKRQVLIINRQHLQQVSGKKSWQQRGKAAAAKGVALPLRSSQCCIR